MGRPLSGSIRRRGNVFLASVPKRRGETGRCEASFKTDADAQAWCTAQVIRLQQGLEAELPVTKVTQPRPALPAMAETAALGHPTVTELHKEWSKERYISLAKAEADRASAIEQRIRKLLLPALDHLYSLEVVAQRELLVSWLQLLSGREPDIEVNLQIREKGYAQAYIQELVWALGQISDRAVLLRGLRPLPLVGLAAMHPEGYEKRVAPLVTLRETARIAASLNVVHQIVLWLLRLAGLRIGEAYGLRVSSLVLVDNDDRPDCPHGFLLVKEQAGKRYRQFTKKRDGVENVSKKKKPKTSAGYRLVAIPPSLTRMLMKVIEVFHTHDGKVAFDDHLVPTIRSETGGQAGFRSALRAAAGDEFDLCWYDDGDGEADPMSLVPHDLRKGYGTDLGWDESIAELLRKRSLGHRAGGDVTSLVYTLDSRLLEHLLPVATSLQTDIDQHGVILSQPTMRRPLYGRNIDRDYLRRVDARLGELGWQVRTVDADRIDTAEAAVLLDMSESATRRLFPDVIHAVKDDNGAWWPRLDDVTEYRDRHEHLHSLDDIAATAGRSYHQAYQLAKKMKLTPLLDERARQNWYSDADRDALLDEFRRVDALTARSMSVADACALLGTNHSAIGRMAQRGTLTFDEERDTANTRYVTRSSIDAELARRGRRQRSSTPVSLFESISGLTSADVEKLVKRKLLTRAGRNGLCPDSIARWVAGYRPDLLTTELGQRPMAG